MPTPVVIRGFGDALTPAEGAGLYNGVTGSPTVVADVTSPSGYALQCSPSGAAERAGFDYGGTSYAIVVMSFYIKLTSIPSGDCELAFASNNADTDRGGLHFDSASGKFAAGFSSSGTPQVGGSAISANQWYRIDLKIDYTGTTRTVDWYLDGVSQTQATTTGTATDSPNMRLGTGLADTFTARYHSCVVSVTSGDFPLTGSDHLYVARLDLTSDGTHNNSGGDITDESSNAIDGSTYYAYTQLDDIESAGTTPRIQQETNASGAYVEANFEDIPTNDGVVGASALLCYSTAAKQANDGACIISKDSFSSFTEVWGTPSAQADYSDLGLNYVPVVISGVTTEALANALQVRLGYSSDASPDPYWLSLIAEVAYVVSGWSGVSPTGIASAEAFGTPSVGATVSPTGIASAEAFGTPNIGHEVLPTGIASAEAFGTPTLDAGVSPTGIESAETFGTASLGATIIATGIASAETFGTPGVGAGVDVGAGVASAEAFGSPTVSANISPDGIISAEAFGTPNVGGGPSISDAGNIASAEAFGSPALSADVTASGIASAEAFGTPSVESAINPTSIASAEAFGSPTLDASITGAGNIASAEAFGGPVVGTPEPSTERDEMFVWMMRRNR